MKRFKQVVLSLTLALLLVAPASADFNWNYPDGSFANIQASGGGTRHLVVFFDWAVTGDLDVFALYTTHTSLPVLGSASVGSTQLPTAFAYWLDFRGTSGGFLMYDVYADQGVGFFYVVTVFV